MTNILLSFPLIVLMMGCGHDAPSVEPDKPSGPQVECRWDFDDVEGWAYAHQDTASISQWSVENGSLYLRTRANTRDRSKMYTTRNDFQSGEYTWRIFISNIKPYEQVSIAGFIYQDDEHEIDFEIGYGTRAARQEYGAKDGDLLACMTNQAHPYSSAYCPISPGWHTFTIKLEESSSKYLAYWIIDGETKQKLPLDFGRDDTHFTIMCSVENLLFIGEKIPENDNYGRFDYVTFKGTVKEGSDPEDETIDKSFRVEGDFPKLDKAQAGVFAGSKEYAFTYSKKNGTLDGKISRSADYIALYPYDDSASANRIGVKTYLEQAVTASLKESQVSSLCIAKSENDTFDFDNVMSTVQFRIPESKSPINAITVNAKSICGSCTIDMDTHEVYAEGESLVVNAPDGEFKTGTDYYFAIPAGKYSTFEITDRSGNISLSKTNLKADKESVLNLGELTPKETPDIRWEETRWDFDKSIEGWYYYTHTANQSQQCYSLEDGCVKIWTDANTMDRNKLHTFAKNFGEGVYTFRTYVTEIAAGEKCSIGAFIYSDDTHEIDFEIGYGTSAARKGCGAKDSEMVACMTNQGLPFNSTYTPISVGWHDLTLELETVNGKYRIKWYIDSSLKKTLDVNFGPQTKFLISISVENLEFMGDFQPTHTNYALFDYVSYKKKITN